MFSISSFHTIIIIFIFLLSSLFCFNIYKSKETIALEFLTKNNYCVEGLSCFNDYYKALDFAIKVEKPLLIYFTGYACLGGKAGIEFKTFNNKNKSIIKENYVFVTLYVDDRTALPQKEQITIDYIGKQRKLKTIGDKWSYFEYINFEQVSQPFFVLLTKDEKLLNKPIGYSSKNMSGKFEAFLKCRLQ